MVNQKEKLTLRNCLTSLMNNDPSKAIMIDFGVLASNVALKLIENPNWDSEDIECADVLIRISNIMYNNSTFIVLPLDDGVYDQLLTIYKKYNPHYNIGAIPLNFKEQAEGFIDDSKIMYESMKPEQEKGMFVKDIWKQHTSLLAPDRPVMLLKEEPPIRKRQINTKHNYPELVGTLDKCKFVTNADAQAANVFDKPSVDIFERDYIHMCLSRGIIYPNEVFQMIAELKYDGVSVEAEVCGDTIVSALSRGDTGEDLATDLTPIFKNYKFYNAKNVSKDDKFGIKFEAIITKRNLDILNRARGKNYRNCRNAIIGILGAADGPNYVDYITLIPLKTSYNPLTTHMDRESELQFLNTFYNTGEYNRYVVMQGTYQQIIYQVKKFVEDMENMRPILPYLIDGVVMSFIDPGKIAMLGRVNSVNKYQMAIKFNPKNARSIFLGYTYSMGKTGEIIPMAHFKPVEFIGTIHTKQTIHSYQRFKELALRKGNEIDISYVNDVMTYISKPNTENNRRIDLANAPEPFIEYCPCCGSKLIISDTGKMAKCTNPFCHEKQLMRAVDMLNILGFRDFSEETIRTMDLTSFVRLATPFNMEELTPIIGPVNAEKFITQQHDLLNNPIEDFKLMAAMSFYGMAIEKWKKVLRVYTIRELLSFNSQELTLLLGQIKDIGRAIIDSIIYGFEIYNQELSFALNHMKIIDSKGQINKPKVVLSGTRDPMLIGILLSTGYDCDEKYNISKDTAFLITPDKNANTTKIEKARKYNIPIVTPKEFFEMMNIQVTEF